MKGIKCINNIHKEREKRNMYKRYNACIKDKENVQKWNHK